MGAQLCAGYAGAALAALWRVEATGPSVLLGHSGDIYDEIPERERPEEGVGGGRLQPNQNLGGNF